MNKKNDRIIYMDNAATTRLCDEALKAMLPYYTELYANPSGVYDFAERIKRSLGQAREDIAGAIGASVREIFFTGGGTESDNIALRGIAAIKENPHFIVTAFEHHAVLAACRMLEKDGVRISYVNPTRDGYADIDEIARHIRKETVLVSVMTANNELGTVQPVARIGALAHEHGVLFHTDAVAACGHIPIDVKAMNIDLLSASAHKFKGPKGAGFLYVAEGNKPLPIIFGGGQERGLRSGTENVPGIMGMAASLVAMDSRMDENLKRRRELDAYFIKKLGNTDLINGPVGCFEGSAGCDRTGGCGRLPGHFNIKLDGIDSEEIIVRLGMKGICVSAGAACATSDDSVSHVLESIGLKGDMLKRSVRVTMNEDNTEEEIDILFDHIGEYLKR